MKSTFMRWTDRLILWFGFLALAVVGHATTILTESNSGTPTFSPDSTLVYSGQATFPCNQAPLSGNDTPCNLMSSWTLASSVTVSGSGLELLNNASQNGGAALPIGSNDWLIYVAAGQSITFNFASPVQGAGAILDTDVAKGSVIANGATYSNPSGLNFPYFLGVTDSSGTLSSLTLTAGSSGFLLDSLSVQNADTMAPTAEATPLVLVGTGLCLLGWYKRRYV